VLTLGTGCCCEVLDLLLSWVLAQRAEHVSERLLRDTLRAPLVKQRKRLLGLCKSVKGEGAPESVGCVDGGGEGGAG